MNKLLLSSAVAVLALAAVPAFAQDDSTLKLNLGGHFKGYVNYNSDDASLAGANTNEVDILKQTEVHFGGETTLDNGLTVGAQIEATADASDPFLIDESYMYLAGSWGRVNFGDEDGAAYLLQVAAPSADDNVDGIRQFINPVHYSSAIATATGYSVGTTYAGGLDYDNDLAGNSEKITYLSPVYSGFQGGVSFTPQANSTTQAGNGNTARSTTSVDNVWEAALRYEGSFNNVGTILGAGYTKAEDQNEWNVGADFDIGAFGLGAVYTAFNTDVAGANDSDTWVVGGDYTTGPFKLGVSYLNNDLDNVVQTDRYTGGVVYTYGPGMSFRGSVSYADFNDNGAAFSGDENSTSVLLGTQVNF